MFSALASAGFVSSHRFALHLTDRAGSHEGHRGATKEWPPCGVSRFHGSPGVNVDNVEQGDLIDLCSPLYAYQAIRIREALIQLAELRRILQPGSREQQQMARGTLIHQMGVHPRLGSVQS
eukprot:g26899.t1